jgi:hypothetical protein
MKRFLRISGVSMIAWVGVIAVAGIALASALDSSDLSLTVSPKGVLTGKTLDSDEPFEMTLHLQGDSATQYDLAVTYSGDVGSCQADSGVLHTNPRGKAVWTCELDTAENAGTSPLDGTVTFAVSKDGAEVKSLVAILFVRPAEQPDTTPTPTPTPTEVPETEPAVNHGHCVSYWAHESKSAGLEGKLRGAFISSIAGDTDAVAPTGNDPVAPSCDYTDELRQALAEQEAAAEESSTEGARPRKGAKGKPQSEEGEPTT